MQETQETQIQFLGQETSLEKEMANHSSILASKIPLTEEPGKLQYMGSAETQTLPSESARMLIIMYQTGNINKEIRIIKRNQMQIMMLKNNNRNKICTREVK